MNLIFFLFLPFSREQYWSFTRGTRWSSKFKPISHPVPGLHKKLWAEVCIYLVSKLSILHVWLSIKLLKILYIGATRLIGKSGACYTADPGLNPGGARNDYTNRSFFLTSFRFSNFKRICRVANNAATISQMVKAIKIKLLNLGHLHSKVHARAQRRGTNLS